MNAADELVAELVAFDVHPAFVGYEKAQELGLPIEFAANSDQAWTLVWRMYAKYAPALAHEPIKYIVEGRRVSLPIYRPTV